MYQDRDLSDHWVWSKPYASFPSVPLMLHRCTADCIRMGWCVMEADEIDKGHVVDVLGFFFHLKRLLHLSFTVRLQSLSWQNHRANFSAQFSSACLFLELWSIHTFTNGKLYNQVLLLLCSLEIAYSLLLGGHNLCFSAISALAG